MDLPELPQRIYTIGEKRIARKIILYHTDDSKLFNAVREALHDDEYEELKNSNFQLNIKKKYELWSLVGPQPVRFSLIEFEHLTGLYCDYIEDLENPRREVTKEMISFWEMMGVDVVDGPTSEQIIAACERCEEWSREDRMRLEHLSILTGFIEERNYSTATRASLARLVMDLEEFENYPWGRVAFKVLMDYVNGKKLQKNCTVDGFIQVLQVWVYYALPKFAASFGKPIPNRLFHRCWLTRVPKDADFLKSLSTDLYYKRHSLRLPDKTSQNTYS
ncbi:hypothetical protein F2Q70_00016194 [Brassica cretica]|uniref:DUF1985 domain-containing protein n=1 Tax=Brassica cretica TaxID=69181 RepID=A0A8S9I3N0_BRACR|nr:hypothetical protein F2Q70_00016194 [Brassica cretica]